jgi:hypothetical protein
MDYTDTIRQIISERRYGLEAGDNDLPYAQWNLPIAWLIRPNDKNEAEFRWAENPGEVSALQRKKGAWFKLYAVFYLDKSILSDGKVVDLLSRVWS